jgi:hypothetical protein
LQPQGQQQGQEQGQTQGQQQGQQGAGLQNQQPVVNGALVRRICGSKPPKFTADGGFDLYRAQLEGNLVHHGCWDVVDGSAEADPADHEWVELNQFARCALLIGLLPRDSKKVCKMATAREMWISFEDDNTKRAYGSEIRLRRDLYAARFESGESMMTYLDRLEEMHRQLANMNAVIPDAVTGLRATHKLDATHNLCVAHLLSINQISVGGLTASEYALDWVPLC